MKYNLKNFPLKPYVHDYQVWKENFEKELRQRIAEAEKFEQCSASKTEICCFKEILGISQK